MQGTKQSIYVYLYSVFPPFKIFILDSFCQESRIKFLNHVQFGLTKRAQVTIIGPQSRTFFF